MQQTDLAKKLELTRKPNTLRKITVYFAQEAQTKGLGFMAL